MLLVDIGPEVFVDTGCGFMVLPEDRQNAFIQHKLCFKSTLVKIPFDVNAWWKHIQAILDTWKYSERQAFYEQCYENPSCSEEIINKMVCECKKQEE